MSVDWDGPMPLTAMRIIREHATRIHDLESQLLNADAIGEAAVHQLRVAKAETSARVAAQEAERREWTALVEQLRSELRVAMADADGWKQSRDDYVARCHDLEQANDERWPG